MTSLLVIVLSLACLFPCVLSQGRGRTPGGVWLTVMDGTPTGYRSQIAHFGNQFVGVQSFDANLMLPTDESTLCEYPPSLVNMTRQEAENLTSSPTQRPIALFVSRGNCSFDQKARVAIEIQQELVSFLKYVIIYNNNETEQDNLVVMSSEATGLSAKKLEALGYLFVSTKTGEEIMAKIKSHANSTNSTTPFLLNTKFLAASNNATAQWYLPLFGEVVPPRSDDGSSSNGDAGSNSAAHNSFYWLRFILFSLLILSPCVRAGYLWYSAGGRILLRRNQAGRVTGIQYIRPMPYWFASGNDAHADENKQSILTEEEVDALPVLVYKRIKGDGDVDDDVNDEEEVKTTGQDGDLADVETKASIDSGKVMESVDVEQPAELPTEQAEPALSAEPEIVVVAEEGETEGEVPITTTCTMCSICIDDFEDGETIRVLPKCRHGFHTECIKPWLTERQSCCPLCKTNVLDTENDADDTSSSSGDNNNSNNNNNVNQDSPA